MKDPKVIEAREIFINQVKGGGWDDLRLEELVPAFNNAITPLVTELQLLRKVAEATKTYAENLYMGEHSEEEIDQALQELEDVQAD